MRRRSTAMRKVRAGRLRQPGLDGRCDARVTVGGHLSRAQRRRRRSASNSVTAPEPSVDDLHETLGGDREGPICTSDDHRDRRPLSVRRYRSMCRYSRRALSRRLRAALRASSRGFGYQRLWRGGRLRDREHPAATTLTAGAPRLSRPPEPLRIQPMRASPWPAPRARR